MKIKCKCGHARDVHAPLHLQGIYNNNNDECDGECCVIYRIREGPLKGDLKSCYCMKFEGEVIEVGGTK